jgi:hypothetical protein
MKRGVNDTEMRTSGFIRRGSLYPLCKFMPGTKLASMGTRQSRIPNFEVGSITVTRNMLANIVELFAVLVTTVVTSML